MSRWIADLNWKGNVYVGLALSLLLVMGLYSISRVGFYLFNTSFFPDMTWSRFSRIMVGGLRFDLAAVLYSNALFILLLILPIPFKFKDWYQRMLKWIFLVTNAFAFAVNTADFIYYRFTLRRTTLSVLNQFENEQNLGGLLFQFLADYWYALFFWLAILVLLIVGFKKIKIQGPQLKNRWLFYGSSLGAMLLIVYLFIGGVRGGFQHSTRPITLSNAAAYAKVPKDINLVLNTPFALMRTAKADVIQKVNYFNSEEELTHYFNPVKVPPDSVEFHPQNVVVIILESFSKEFVGTYNHWLDNGNYKGYTPFLDSIVDVGQSYQYSFANGRKSIDAMPSVIASIPSIEVPYVLSHFSGNKINSTANLLKEKGYYTAFFHGAPNGSMGFDAFANLCGFDDYYGKDEYNHDEDYDGIWGVWDEKFMQFFASKMNTFQQPFYTTFFSVSSHHPYKLPAGYDSKFKGGSRDIYKTIEYTDYSLKRFFETASRMPWYKNTLFVITADHASAEIGYREYNTAWGYFSIPIFFYRPGMNLGGLRPQIIQQADIMPTILGYLGYDKPYVAFGRNLISESSQPFAFNYLDNMYQAFVGSYLLQFDGTKSVGLYNFKEDKFLKDNLLEKLPDTVRSIEPRLKAFVQQYNNRMVDDNLTVEGSQLKLMDNN